MCLTDTIVRITSSKATTLVLYRTPSVSQNCDGPAYIVDLKIRSSPIRGLQCGTVDEHCDHIHHPSCYHHREASLPLSTPYSYCLFAIVVKSHKHKEDFLHADCGRRQSGELHQHVRYVPLYAWKQGIRNCTTIYHQVFELVRIDAYLIQRDISMLRGY